VFENMVLRGIFGPRRDEVTGEWRRLHNEELNDLYCSPNIVRVRCALRDGKHKTNKDTNVAGIGKLFLRV